MHEADRALVLTKLHALVAADVDPMQFVILEHEGTPEPKARARTGRGGRHYTPAATVHAEHDLACCFRSMVDDRSWLGNVAIVAVFFRPNRQRIDVDNLLKLVMDAATAANVWRDDCQVTAQAAFLELDAERPRTLIGLSPTTSSLDRTVDRRRRPPSLPLEGGTHA